MRWGRLSWNRLRARQAHGRSREEDRRRQYRDGEAEGDGSHERDGRLWSFGGGVEVGQDDESASVRGRVDVMSYTLGFIFQLLTKGLALGLFFFFAATSLEEVHSRIAKYEWSPITSARNTVQRFHTYAADIQTCLFLAGLDLALMLLVTQYGYYTVGRISAITSPKKEQ